jgi:hypothetical protein
VLLPIKVSWQVFYSPIHCFVHIYSQKKKHSLFKILSAVAAVLLLPMIEAEKGEHFNCMYFQKENMSLVVLQKLSLYQLSFLCSMPTNQSVYTTRNLISKELKIQRQDNVQGVRLSTLVKTARREKRDDSNSYWNQEYGNCHYNTIF